MTQFSDEIKKLIDNTPNDAILGEKIRDLYRKEKDKVVREGLGLPSAADDAADVMSQYERPLFDDPTLD
jgi:hypothetical protein